MQREHSNPGLAGRRRIGCFLTPSVLVLVQRVDRDGSAGGAAIALPTVELRGYPIREDGLNPHIILVQTTEVALAEFGTPEAGQGSSTQLCATVTKRFLDQSKHNPDLRLLNLLSAEQAAAVGQPDVVSAGQAAIDQLHSLASTLRRIEHVGYILAWSEVGPSGDASFTVDLVELHRQQLSFRRRKEQGRSGVRLYSVEMPTLYIYSPPDGKWPAGILPLIDDIPHGLVMLSDTQELQLLLPNMKLLHRTGRLFTERDADWDRTVQTSYFIYEVHVSKQFLISVSLVSALYLCMIRFLSEDFAACFEMLDSVATDRAFDMEEKQERARSSTGPLRASALPPFRLLALARARRRAPTRTPRACRSSRPSSTPRPRTPTRRRACASWRSPWRTRPSPCPTRRRTQPCTSRTRAACTRAAGSTRRRSSS